MKEYKNSFGTRHDHETQIFYHSGLRERCFKKKKERKSSNVTALPVMLCTMCVKVQLIIIIESCWAPGLP